ncbi:guanylate kinase [Oxalobacter paraformigenes]|uniref:Guanylate kinase n=1 Tax=Oxalobacter paraformigenes TaxID=556268 RepID=C3X4X9_9BURK|nr:guanylate kinase [Oxalobacter paraformigenes]EEO28265.1 guanylate kinase [Oxalobacter paraformigenes]
MTQAAQSFSGSSLFTVTAPSGAGKSSLLAALIRKDPSLRLSISHTTRPPRPGEQNGREYHFTNIADFRKRLEEGEFLEHAIVHGNYYGTSKLSVLGQLDAGHDTLLEIDWQGARQIRKLFPETISVFILPPSISVLEERLVKRGQDSGDIIKQRILAADEEIRHASEFDYVIINYDFDLALAKLAAIVETARCRITRQAIKNRDLFAQFGIRCFTGL